MLSINEIHEKYNRERILRYLVGLILLIIILIIALIIFKVLPESYSFVVLLIFLVAYFISIFLPELSTYELVRYHLSKLNESLNNKNLKNSIHHLNKLNYNLAKFNDELEDSFLLHSSKETLNEFWKLLKYQVYPYLINNDFHSFAEVLKDIEFAFNQENINNLNKILEDFVSENADTNILLPYEKPPILNRIIQSIRSKIQTNFQKNYFFRLLCITLLLLIIGYLISTKTTLKFDNTLISALIIAAVAIAKEYK